MSMDQFPISTPESPFYKGILWRRSIVRHLQNLQRRGGFKRFNQHAVSLIIAETDPRKQAAAHASSIAKERKNSRSIAIFSSTSYGFDWKLSDFHRQHA